MSNCQSFVNELIRLNMISEHNRKRQKCVVKTYNTDESEGDPKSIANHLHLGRRIKGRALRCDKSVRSYGVDVQW
jgi:hypothetical protein